MSIMEKYDKKSFGKEIVIWIIALIICIIGILVSSCKTYRILPVDEVVFDINNVIEYDADRNICTYELINVYNYNNELRIVRDTVALSLEGVLFEELEQGTDAYISNGRVLYD